MVTMPTLGPTELIIILLIVLFVFGAGHLADLGGALGRGIRDFRKAIRDEDDSKPAEQSSQPRDVTS